MLWHPTPLCPVLCVQQQLSKCQLHRMTHDKRRWMHIRDQEQSRTDREEALGTKTHARAISCSRTDWQLQGKALLPSAFHFTTQRKQWWRTSLPRKGKRKREKLEFLKPPHKLKLAKVQVTFKSSSRSAKPSKIRLKNLIYSQSKQPRHQSETISGAEPMETHWLLSSNCHSMERKGKMYF